MICRVIVAALALFTLGALPAEAQFAGQGSGRATGEDYHVELAFAWWDADPSLIISSESIGIPGDDIDLVRDLGIEKKRLPEFRAVLRPAKKHKFRFHWMPIKYEAETVLQREFVFNGQRYRVGLPVNTLVDLKTMRFGYEYDFIYRERGYLGLLLDLKYTDTTIELVSPIGDEFTSAVAPIPTIGAVGRGYITRNISITGEVSFFKVPERLSDDYQGRYLDYDFYGTVNFTNNIGAQAGLRSVDVFYDVDEDRGDLTFKGWYVSGVVRF